MAKPTNKEIKRVRTVLYEKKRLRRIFEAISSIDVLLDFDNADGQNRGPAWYSTSDGQLSASVLEAAKQCRTVATVLLQIRDDLAQVDFNGDDKRHLREALKQQAASWSARGDVWSTPGQPPDDVNAVVAPITAHQVSCLKEAEHVTDYLKANSGFNFGPGS